MPSRFLARRMGTFPLWGIVRGVRSYCQYLFLDLSAAEGEAQTATEYRTANAASEHPKRERIKRGHWLCAPAKRIPSSTINKAAPAAVSIHSCILVSWLWTAPMKKREDRNPTMHDVAKVARVGRMTISRVLNNSPAVRPSTRKRVLLAIAELGYQQNEAARMLRGQRAMMIGLIVPDLSDSFFAACAQTVQDVAHTYGYDPCRGLWQR